MIPYPLTDRWNRYLILYRDGEDKAIRVIRWTPPLLKMLALRYAVSTASFPSSNHRCCQHSHKTSGKVEVSVVLAHTANAMYIKMDLFTHTTSSSSTGRLTFAYFHAYLLFLPSPRLILHSLCASLRCASTNNTKTTAEGEPTYLVATTAS